MAGLYGRPKNHRNIENYQRTESSSAQREAVNPSGRGGSRFPLGNRELPVRCGFSSGPSLRAPRTFGPHRGDNFLYRRLCRFITGSGGLIFPVVKKIQKRR
jgi:hypothetical protein